MGSSARQDSLSLSAAYALAAQHHARSHDAERLDAILALGNRNLDTRFRPAITLAGQAVYHSEVASIPIDLPGMSLPSVPHDQYRAGLSVEQLVFDGGRIRAERAVRAAERETGAAEASVAVYGVRQHVEGAYFAVLQADARLESLAALHEDLQARLAQAESLVRRGVATQSSVDVLRVEILRVEQQRIAAESGRQAAVDVLAELTGRSLPESVQLGLPEVSDTEGRRPEHTRFDSERDLIEKQQLALDRSNKPLLATFAEAAVGRPPGLNLFEDALAPFFSVGVRISWSPLDWGAADRRRASLDEQRHLLEAREEAFEQSVRAAAAEWVRAIERLTQLLEVDEQIIALRSAVSRETGSRFERGTATATDYLIERNAEHQARLARDLHRIERAQAQARLNTLRGVL